jgi:hypothetical protein
MADLQAALEDYLAALPPAEWRTLVARVREPDEQQIPKGATNGQD